MQTDSWDALLQDTSAAGHEVIHFLMNTPAETGLFTPARSPSDKSLLSSDDYTHATTHPSPPGLSSTPSDSQPVSDKSTLVSVSTTFYPGSSNDPAPTDLIVVSSDQVFFYVHHHRLNAASENAFNGLLAVPWNLPRKDTKPNDTGNEEPDPIIAMPEVSPVLNVILHAAYNISCAHYYPSFDTITTAIAAFKLYGIPLSKQLALASPFQPVVLAHAPVYPIEVYALAAEHDVEDFAIACSPHLLTASLPALTDEHVARMGPIYLKKLFFLHLGRIDALKRLLLAPPHPHGPTAACDFVEQKKLTRAWALASAYLAWDARPDMSAASMEAALLPLADHLWCEQCRVGLKDRVTTLIVQWSCVKTTI